MTRWIIVIGERTLRPLRKFTLSERPLLFLLYKRKVVSHTGATEIRARMCLNNPSERCS